MEIVVRGRGGGKTQIVAQALADDPSAVCYVPSMQMGQYVMDRVVKLSGRSKKQVERQFFTASNLDRMRGLSRPSKVFVEELDSFLAVVLGVGVDTATFTGEMDIQTGYANGYTERGLALPRGRPALRLKDYFGKYTGKLREIDRDTLVRISHNQYEQRIDGKVWCVLDADELLWIVQ